jgi:hypothetical protein
VAAGVVVLPFLLFAMAFAPAHAHESDHHHTQVVLHSHFEPHHLTAHETDSPEVEAGEHVIWLTTVAIHAIPFQLDLHCASSSGVGERDLSSESWATTLFNDSAPPHGPPGRPSSPRAPPFLPV